MDVLERRFSTASSVPLGKIAVRRRIDDIIYKGTYCGQILNDLRHGDGIEYLRGKDNSSVFYQGTYRFGEIVKGI
jgi:hypothetical protein